MKSKIGRKPVIVVLVFVLSLILFVPFSTTTIPECKVKVVDRTGSPISVAEVRQIWSHSSGTGENTESRFSDKEGYVVFPARIMFSPLIVRIFIGVIDLLNFITVGGSIGGYSYIVCPIGKCMYADGNPEKYKDPVVITK